MQRQHTVISVVVAIAVSLGLTRDGGVGAEWQFGAAGVGVDGGGRSGSDDADAAVVGSDLADGGATCARHGRRRSIGQKYRFSVGAVAGYHRTCLVG